jgi:hypothetical protein
MEGNTDLAATSGRRELGLEAKDIEPFLADQRSVISWQMQCIFDHLGRVLGSHQGGHWLVREDIEQKSRYPLCSIHGLCLHLVRIVGVSERLDALAKVDASHLMFSCPGWKFHTHVCLQSV